MRSPDSEVRRHQPYPAEMYESETVLSAVDRLASWRRGERDGRVVAGEVQLSGTTASHAQELRAGGDRDVGASRVARVPYLQRGLSRDRGGPALYHAFHLATERAGELARITKLANRAET